MWLKLPVTLVPGIPEALASTNPYTHTCTNIHRIRTVTALAEEPGSVSSTHTRLLFTYYNSNSRGSNALFWLLWAPQCLLWGREQGSALCTPSCPETFYVDRLALNLQRTFSLAWGIPSAGIKDICHQVWLHMISTNEKLINILKTLKSVQNH